MNPDEPFVLSGKNAEKFDEYRKRKATKDEIDFMLRSEKFYLKHRKIRP